MTDPSDFPDPMGGNRPPRPPRVPRPSLRPGGGDGPQFNMPQIPRKLLGVLFVLLFIVVLGLVAVLTGRAGIIEINDREVGVIVNYVNGKEEVVNQPGYKIFIPFLEQAFKFDKSPQEFKMSGDRDLDDNHVRKLTVRAKDGSNFWFEELTIQYRLVPSAANLVLNDSGEGTSFKQNWVRTFARSILRDEFGKYSAEEAANPSSYKTARINSREKLNAVLGKHGIEITEIITPKPKFEAQYELAISQRKVANQEVEKLKIKAMQLVQERDRRLADIDRDMATEFELLKGTLEASRIAAEQNAVQLRLNADARKISTLAVGTAAELEMTERARGLTAQARKEAEGLIAKVEALAKRGEVLVREKLAEKFGKIRFEIVPYRRDPSPIRIEHLEGSNRGGNQ
jgi:SPFH domain/Band 7 family protein